MRNEALEAFETRLGSILDEIDALLEAAEGDKYTRHPARPPHGATPNPQYAGLFAVSAKFTAGIGSEYGSGYSLDLRASTLAPVSPKQQSAWEETMVTHLRKRLPEIFPDRHLEVVRDSLGWKLIGDLSL